MLKFIVLFSLFRAFSILDTSVFKFFPLFDYFCITNVNIIALSGSIVNQFLLSILHIGNFSIKFNILLSAPILVCYFICFTFSCTRQQKYHKSSIFQLLWYLEISINSIKIKELLTNVFI